MKVINSGYCEPAAGQEGKLVCLGESSGSGGWLDFASLLPGLEQENEKADQLSGRACLGDSGLSDIYFWEFRSICNQNLTRRIRRNCRERGRRCLRCGKVQNFYLNFIKLRFETLEISFFSSFTYADKRGGCIDPDGYTDVFAYKNWIQKTMRKN